MAAPALPLRTYPQPAMAARSYFDDVNALFSYLLLNVAPADVASFATSGTGTQADPWLGWEVAFSAVSGGNYFGTPKTTYFFRSGWFRTPNTMVLTADDVVYGTGKNTVIHYTGAGIGINLNGTAGSPELTNNIGLRNFHLRSTGGTIGLSVYNTSALKVVNVAIHGTVTDGASITGWTTAGLSIGGNGAGFSVINFFDRFVSQGLVGDAVQFTSGPSNIENTTFVQCNLQGVGGHCVNMLTRCINTAFYGCEIEGSSLSIVRAPYFYNLSFYDCAFEGSASTSLIEIGATNPVGDSCGPFNFVGNYVSNGGSGYCLSLGAAVNLVGGLLTGNLLLPTGTPPGAVKLGTVVQLVGMGNRVSFSPKIFDTSTAVLTSCYLDDVVLGNVNTGQVLYQNTEDNNLMLIRSRSLSNDLISIYFADSIRGTRGKLSVKNLDQTVNAGALLATVGDGAAALKDVMQLNIFGTAAGDTAMMLYDVTAGTLRRVSIGAANSESAGFRNLRIPN